MKQERYFVCSGSELEAAIKAHREAVARSNLPHWEFEAKRAEAACRAREVPEHAMSFYCREYSKEDPAYIVRQWFEELKK